MKVKDQAVPANHPLKRNLTKMKQRSPQWQPQQGPNQRKRPRKRGSSSSRKMTFPIWMTISSFRQGLAMVMQHQLNRVHRRVSSPWTRRT